MDLLGIEQVCSTPIIPPKTLDRLLNITFETILRSTVKTEMGLQQFNQFFRFLSLQIRAIRLCL